jgi:hypothetical protein
MAGSSFITTTGTSAQPTAGQAPLLEFSRAQRFLNCVLAEAIGRGDLCGLTGQDMHKDNGTAVDNFAVCLNARTANQAPAKAQFMIGGGACLVNVANGDTAGFNKPLIVTNTATVKNRAAEAANKVCGMGWGTIDQQDGKVLQTDVVGPALVLMYIKPWTVLT